MLEDEVAKRRCAEQRRQSRNAGTLVRLTAPSACQAIRPSSYIEQEDGSASQNGPP